MPITITAADAVELTHLLDGLGYSLRTPTVSAEPVSAAVDSEQPKPRGRGRPKAAPAEPASAPAEPQPIADMKDPTVEDARAALQKYFAKHGPDKARELVRKHGAAKVSEIPADKLAAFVEEALT